VATTLGLLTLAAALISFGILARVRGVGRFVSGLGAVLLLASGAYVVYYWLTAGRVLLTQVSRNWIPDNPLSVHAGTFQANRRNRGSREWEAQGRSRDTASKEVWQRRSCGGSSVPI
jgi:hypothetical protein